MSALGDVAVGVVARAKAQEAIDALEPAWAWAFHEWVHSECDENNDPPKKPTTREHAAAALASLDSPAVVQGIAEVLAPHVEAPRDRQAWPRDIYDAWNEAATRSYTEADEVADGMWRLMVAQALVAALGGRADPSHTP